MNIIFFGPPQVGKGTNARIVSEKLGIPHISTGDMFRRMAEEKDPLGVEVKEKYWGKGLLVPDDITTKLLFERLRREDCKSGYILDGYPRTLKQAQDLDEHSKINWVINLTAKDSVLIERASNRRTCSNKNCNAVFNLLTVKPKKEGICDKCGSRLYQRDDEKHDIFKKRLEVYRKQTLPLVDFYSKKRILVNVDGTGEIKGIVREIMKVLKK